jgi:hypothetical protein
LKLDKSVVAAAASLAFANVAIAGPSTVPLGTTLGSRLGIGLGELLGRPLGDVLGLQLGQVLPVASGGLMLVAAASLVTGIVIVRRKLKR